MGLIPRSSLRLFDRFDLIPRSLLRGSSFQFREALDTENEEGRWQGLNASFNAIKLAVLNNSKLNPQSRH